MYRALRERGESRDRRRQRSLPARKKPELLARRPNDVWSWDITKLKGPERSIYYQLYVIIDIFSRYVPGWLVTPAESAELAETLISSAITRSGQAPGTIHADRGSSMTSGLVAQLLSDLGVARSHSRPHVSDDNPSQAGFKTFKYFPTFPERLGSIQDARALCLGSACSRMGWAGARSAIYCGNAPPTYANADKATCVRSVCGGCNHETSGF
ncbi:MAG: DDE-type integrase/transposase/recombinase [Actinobacteria bacterium]|nr:DDE-type integrase/transposase/recombinase [Actinomycetota bacterium]